MKVHIKVNSEVTFHKDIMKEKFKNWSTTLQQHYQEIYNSQIKLLPEKLNQSQPILSAILVPLLFNQYNDLYVLATVRHNSLSLFEGEVCMPGGKCEDSETPKETALRETLEEIGLHQDNIEILCEGPSILYYRNGKVYVVCPVYGLIKKSFYATLSKNEVIDIFTVNFSKVLEGYEGSLGVPGCGILTNKTFKIIGLSHFVIAIAASAYYRKMPHKKCFSYTNKSRFFTDFFEYYMIHKL
ncbi:nudix hydrolase 3 [Hydra vulgaris]|uniref:Nudix hydrolase 3 n=1 Tax=Hydra vulgaris TaxID=6087 RepID=A0ABM4CCE4_HYDVU